MSLAFQVTPPLVTLHSLDVMTLWGQMEHDVCQCVAVGARAFSGTMVQSDNEALQPSWTEVEMNGFNGTWICKSNTKNKMGTLGCITQSLYTL
jgi:hypothetical protein